MKCYIKDYPRPQFVRKQWTNLNGPWDFAFDDAKKGRAEKWYGHFPEESLTIQVPFACETERSGIHSQEQHESVWYHRIITVEKGSLEGNRLILHFEGSDFLTRVWVNGQYAGSHRGGYARFSFDVTDLVHEGDNDLTVQAEDSTDMQQPRGKQRWLEDSFGCWYVQTTGIWKTVWTELVPEIRLDRIKMTPLFDQKQMKMILNVTAPKECFGEELVADIRVSFHGKPVNRVCTAVFSGQTAVNIDMNVNHPDDLDFVWGYRIWSPGEPDLYDVELSLSYKGQVTDEVGSYCAMREIRIEGQNILLNGKPIYQRLILDQGYWKDTHLTPPDEEALIQDIDRIREMGFNGLRKHQKVEDERFLYWCDVKGLLVWSEAPAAYIFTDDALREFAAEWTEIVEQNYNHPCIITWTPFNESWGVPAIGTRQDQQHFTEAVYHLTKSMDPLRPVIVNDGWEHTVSDIITLHDYEEKGEILNARYVDCREEILSGKVYHNEFRSAFASGYHYRGQPVIISEYGGIAFNNDDSGWGYGNKVADEESFLRRFDEITTAIKEIPYVCGYCYTQVSDVQQEINGLMDMERNCKVDPAKLREINLRIVGYRMGEQNQY